MSIANHEAKSIRFEFGENWSNYLSLVDEDRIREATARLSEMLGDIRDKTFLEIGSGSGIHSLSAVRLGARQVLSFDNDVKSVECTREMKRRFAPQANWRVEQSSVLDEHYMRSIGPFDIVYSWGVLHHTGEMWKALEMATVPVREKLMIAVYNDQGLVSRTWARLKKAYVKHPAARPAVTLASLLTLWGPKVLLQPHRVVSDWRNWYKNEACLPGMTLSIGPADTRMNLPAQKKLCRFFSSEGFTRQMYTNLDGSSACLNMFFKKTSRAVEIQGCQGNIC